MTSPSNPTERSRRVLALALLGPMALSAAMLLVASLLPLRFDLRTFQVQARLETLGLPYSSDFLVLTTDNSIESAEISSFALPQWSFPRGTRRWLTLVERSRGVWSGGFLGVDDAGLFHTPKPLASGWEWTASARPAWLSSFVRDAALVYDTPATRIAFETRLPELTDGKRVFVLGAAERPRVPLARPSLQLTPLVWWRLACVLGVLAVGAGLLAASATGPPALRLLGASAGAVTALGALLAARYLLGQLLPGCWGLVSATLWFGGALLLWRRRRFPALPRLGSRAMITLFVALASYAAIFTLRLDFDGDTYTTYLQVARYYHWAGRHVPQDPGLAALVQGSVYPPGFPILLALPLWVTDQPAATSLALGHRTSLFVLLYRWLALGVYVALLGALAAYVTALSGDPRAGWLSGFSLLFVLPMARAQHVAAETLLVPLLGLSLICVVAGRRFDRPPLAAAGLFLAGLLALVKLDGLPFLLLLVLPAALGPATHWGLRREARLALALVVGLLPWLVWKLSGPAANPSFGQVTPADLLHALPGLAAQAFKIVVKQDLWLPLLLALPAAAIARWGNWRALLPVLGIGAMSCAWMGVYALSTLGNLSHMETSFPRIMLGPCVAAWVYALDALWGASGKVPQPQGAATSPAE